MPALQVRMSSEEYLECRGLAERDGLSLSEWARRRLLERVTVPVKKKVPKKPKVVARMDAEPGEFVPVPADVPPIPDFDDLPQVDFDPPVPDAVKIAVHPGGLESMPPVKIGFPDAVPITLPPADVVSVGGKNFAVFSPPGAPKSRFIRSKKCTSEKCERFKLATCDACKQANAVGFTG